MKKNFNPQYIADCRRQIEKAMKDDSLHCGLRMCDIMTAAATAFGNRSDKEVDRMKAFLLELIVSSMENINKKPDIPYRSKEYCYTLFKRSDEIDKELRDQLIYVCQQSPVFTFSVPVIIIALDDDGYFQEVKIKSLQWKDETRDILMEDTEGNMWTDDDIPLSFVEKLLDQVIDQDLYPHNS